MLSREGKSRETSRARGLGKKSAKIAGESRMTECSHALGMYNKEKWVCESSTRYFSARAIIYSVRSQTSFYEIFRALQAILVDTVSPVAETFNQTIREFFRYLQSRRTRQTAIVSFTADIVPLHFFKASKSTIDKFDLNERKRSRSSDC